ncbi:MAG TPA: DNA polymerase/3'-5' exonuclease PolX [Candidatus Saccharimonadales bacterium]|nr:DNA polymerase/3'-5' exonuclease PolX [Candidatus Saccharimonadales bacterium]
MKNRLVADIFEQMAELMEIQGESGFRVNAYRRAARALDSLQEDVEVLRREGRLTDVPGIGESTAQKVGEFLDTGRVARHQELLKKVPAGLLELLQVPGLGPKSAALLYRELKVRSVDDLRQAIEAGRLADLPGMGEKKIENLRKGLEFRERAAGRTPLGLADAVVTELMAALRRAVPKVILSPAGSLRRMRETVGDLDLLAATTRPADVLQAFVELPQVAEVLAHGDTKASVRVEHGLQVDLRAVAPESYGAALQYFTGSKDHNVRLRDRAKRMGLKINEYGVYRGEKRVAGATEEECYRALGLPWIPPEMREDRGEIDLAEAGKLPRLVELGDIRADLHCHTRASDGDLTLEQLADEALKRGYRYAAVTDHSVSAGYAGGLSAERLKVHLQAVHAFNQKQSKIRLLAGTESDIRTDGGLDYPDELLLQLDWVVVSIHSAFGRDPTGRMVKALQHPATCMLGHPSGRLIGQRDAYEVDWEALFKAAAAAGKAIEINAHWRRLDLDDLRARRARDLGVEVAICTDMHRADEFDNMRFGVGVARRAWLTAADVLNARPWEAFEKWRTAMRAKPAARRKPRRKT